VIGKEIASDYGNEARDVDATYREHDRNTTSNSLLASQVGGIAQPQILSLAAVALPAGNSSSEQQHFYALTRRKPRDDLLAAPFSDDINLRTGTSRGGCVERGRFVRAVDHCDVVVWR
jgi:hypothetical protein